MPLHRGRSCRSSGNRRRCANFLSKPEGPGKTEGPGSGGSGVAGRSGGPEGPGVAGSSGGRETGKNREVGIVDLGGKTRGKTQIVRGKARKLEEKKGGEARSTSHTQNSRIKSNKTSSLQQITKKIGAIFGGDFRIRMKNNKNRLETQRGGSEIVINVALDTKMRLPFLLTVEGFKRMRLWSVS